MNRLCCLALFLCWSTASPAAADCDDDDDCVGFIATGDFDVVQGQVFAGREDGGRAWGPLANLTVSGGQIIGGGEFYLGDGVDLNSGANATINGGVITGTDDGIKIKANSSLLVNGGSIHGDDDGIAAVGTSRVTITGGEISGDFLGLNASEHSRTTWSGGAIDGAVTLRDDASLTLSGNESFDFNNPLRLYDRSMLKILGGNYSGVVEADDDTVIALFYAEDLSFDLFNGGNPNIVVNSTADSTAEVYYVYGITADRTFDSVEAFSGSGVLDGPNARPTTVDLTEDAAIALLFLAEQSIANAPAGTVNHAVITDDSVYNLSGGWIFERQFSRQEAALISGNGRLNMTGGSIFSRSDDGIRIRGFGQAEITGGSITGERDGIDMASSASVVINNADVHGRDDGIFAKDTSSLTLLGGSISGDDDGISATDSATIEILGGTVQGNEYALLATKQATVRVQGGTFQGDLLIGDSSELEFDGGTIQRDLIANSSSNLRLKAGEVQDDLRLSESAQLTMSGGNVRGDIEARDNSYADITGGNVINRIQAQEQATVRLYGKDLRINDGELTGKLLDGTQVETSILALDDGRVLPYEGEDKRIKINETRDQSIAVLGDGPVVHVDLLADSQVTGEVLASDDGRVNFFGGDHRGDVTLLRRGVAAFYGRNLGHNQIDEHVVNVTGRLDDGSTINYNVQLENAAPEQILLFEVLRTSTLITENSYRNIAIMDGESGPTTVEVQGGGPALLHVEARENSRAVIDASDFVSGFLSAWDSGSIQIDNGSIYGYDDGVFLHDDSDTVISGGNVTGNRDGVRVWDRSTFALDAGEVLGNDDGIDSKNDGIVTINGGRVTGSDNGIRAKGDSQVTINGGSVFGWQNGAALSGDASMVIDGKNAVLEGVRYGIQARGDANVRVLAGTVRGSFGAILSEDEAEVEIRGGQLEGGVVADHGGMIEIIGSELVLDGTQLSGRLDDGSPINVRAFSDNGGQIILSGILERACDFTADGACNLLDIDRLLYDGIVTNDAQFDLDGNGTVNLADRDAWLSESGFLLGDFDLNHMVDSGDLNRIALTWTNDGQTSYGSGDSNGDGIIDGQDLNALALNWQGSSAAASTVPEPAGAWFFTWASVLLIARFRGQRLSEGFVTFVGRCHRRSVATPFNQGNRPQLPTWPV